MEKTGLCNEFQNFVHNVKWLRERHGLSKKEMAKIMGIGIQSLNRIERGEFPDRLGVNAIFRLCRRFGVRAPELLGKKFDK